MKNVKNILIISMLGIGILFSSCSSEDVAKSIMEQATGIEDYDAAMDSMDNVFNEALDEMEEEGMLEDSSIDANELKDFHKYMQDNDYDEAIDIYEKYMVQYMEKAKEVEKGNIEGMQDMIALSGIITKISFEILPEIPNVSEIQRERFNELDEKLKKIDKEN